MRFPARTKNKTAMSGNELMLATILDAMEAGGIPDKMSCIVEGIARETATGAPKNMSIRKPRKTKLKVMLFSFPA
jgi:hypothetical protein